MPNHVTNNLTVKGTEKEVKEVFDILRSKDEKNGEVTFDNFAPMPKELEGTNSPSNEPNWYDWAIKNWGTKWGAYDGIIGDEVITFLTAWATPAPAIQKLSALYPNVEIVVEYADEDFSYNVGRYNYKGGEVIDEFAPNGGSYEAVKMALEIQGGADYYFFEMFEDNNLDTVEKIEADEFATAIIKIAYEDNYNPDGNYDEPYLIAVGECIKKLAIVDENFELAKAITDAIELEQKK